MLLYPCRSFRSSASDVFTTSSCRGIDRAFGYLVTIVSLGYVARAESDAPRPGPAHKTEGESVKRGMRLIGAVMFVGLIGGLLATSGGAQQQAPTGTLRIVTLDKEDRGHTVDNPPKQGMRRPPSPGDIGVLRHRLRNTSRERVGSGRVVFMWTGRGGAVVYGVFKLRGGLIAFEGITSRSATDIHAITGGTGAYNGAAGTLTVLKNRPGRTIFTFSFSG
jgi:hypothetical protein